MVEVGWCWVLYSAALDTSREARARLRYERVETDTRTLNTVLRTVFVTQN